MTCARHVGACDLPRSGNSKLTVFAPTNAAFADLPEATLTKARNDKRLLTSIP